MEGSPPGPPLMPMPTMPGPRKTPIGVMILGILVILVGIGTLGLGALLVLGASMMAVGGGSLGGAFGALFAVFGGILAIFGILAILSGVGLIRLRSWAWWLTLIVSIFNFIGGILSPFWYIGVVWLLIIVYLVVVKKHFGARPAGM
jgi:hypothetical protein